MNLEFSGIVIPILSSFILAILSLIFFYYFKRSSDTNLETHKSSQNVGSKKKIKKKLTSLKSNKNEKKSDTNMSDDYVEEKCHDVKHIEIKSSPEIINEEMNKNIMIDRNLIPTKPILRKTDEEILINEKECLESFWSKIPKDEVEILRSRHSSLVSENRAELRDDDLRADSKLSRGQKKRLKAKLKTLDVKQNGSKNDVQTNNNSSNFNENNDDSVEYMEEITNKTSRISRSGILKHPKSESLTSTNSSQISEKIQSYSSVENDERLFMGDFVEDFQTNTLDKETDENMNNYHFSTFVDEYKIDEEKLKLEQEIKELKNERYNLMQKMNEIPSMAANILALKKENELYLKKYDDLDRTCNAMKKELTSSIQKNTSTEGQFVRFKAEKNHQLGFYENEINKLNNKVNILESDNHARVVEQESLKNNIEKLHHMVADKDKCIQNHNMEVNSMKEQLFKKKMDYQDLELQLKNATQKWKEADSQNQSAYEEIQSLNNQIGISRKEKEKIQKEYEEFKHQMKAREREHDSIISSFQYQLDEFRREQQQCIFLNEGNKHEKTKEEKESAINSKSNDPIIPEGYQLVEISTIKKFTTLINESNQKLAEKCDYFNGIINEQKDKERNLLNQNAILNDKYAKLNSDIESHLNEIVQLRKCTESLQRELSKNSETSVEEMKIELEEKCEALRKTEDILVKLESSVGEEQVKWRDCLNGCKEENKKLESELKSQATLVLNQNKKIIELTTLLQSYNHSQSEAMFNGAVSVDFSETSGQ